MNAVMPFRLRFDLPKWQPALGVTAAGVVAVMLASDTVRLGAQTTGEPYAALLPASTLEFPSETDSNSPAVWEIVDGSWTMSLFNSVAGWAEVSRGPSLRTLARHGEVRFATAAPHGGTWFESLILDADSWYGFYHNEREDIVCPGSDKVWPRLGAARSDDRGVTWTDLGPVIETPLSAVNCTTNNDYFVGGAGDFSVMLGPARNYAYFYYSQYDEVGDRVGVSAARMAWADRDQPAGRVDIWSDGAWLPPSEVRVATTTAAPRGRGAEDEPSFETGWNYPLATPIFRSPNRWDDDRAGVDVLWGPSIHWNTALQTYVMLLNRAVSNAWEQGGVYVSFNDGLDAPDAWSEPALVTRGGSWYPQVIGLDPTLGTDKYAGGIARFFMAGKSEHLIVFGRR
jgi:hypothetical protein